MTIVQWVALTKPVSTRLPRQKYIREVWRKVPDADAEVFYGMPMKLFNLLLLNGYDCVAKLEHARDEDLVALRGFGPTLLTELRARVPHA